MRPYVLRMATVMIKDKWERNVKAEETQGS